METWSRGLELFNAERAKHDPAQFYDMDYFEFIKDPIGAVEGIYRHFGIELTDAARAAMEASDAESKQGPRAPKHTYSLEDYGLTAEPSRSASRGCSGFGRADANVQLRRVARRPGKGALDTSSRTPSATACLMLSASLGHARARAGSPPDSRTSAKYAQRSSGLGIPLHRRMAGPSFLTLTETWQNRQSTETRPESGTAHDHAASPRARQPRDPGRPRNPVPSTMIRWRCRSDRGCDHRRRGRRAVPASSGPADRRPVRPACRRGGHDDGCSAFSSSALSLRFSSTSTCHFSLAAVVSTSISNRSVMSGVTSATST